MGYKFSIIIPHFNSFELLYRCLNSIPNSFDIQVIVVDDNSPNRDVFWTEFKGKYPQVLFVDLLKNSGAGAARNVGLRLAMGKWVIFADADDYFVPKAFEIFQRYYHSAADVIYFKSNSINIDTGESSNRHLRINEYIDNFDFQKEETLDNLRFRCYVPWGKMLNRDFLNAYHISFDEVRYSNDVMFSAKVGYYSRQVEVVKDIVYCITTSSNSLTRCMTSESIMCRYNVAVKFHDFLVGIGKEKFQVVILQYFIFSLKYAPSCIFPMLKIAIKHKINIFFGLKRCIHVFRKKSHYLFVL